MTLAIDSEKRALVQQVGQRLIERVKGSGVTLVEMQEDGKGPRLARENGYSTGAATLFTGSGTLLRIGDRLFLLTALHVLKDPRKERVAWIHHRHGGTLRVEQPAIVMAHSDEETDAAVLELHPDWARERGLLDDDTSFISLTDILPVVDPEDLMPGDCIAIYGTPKQLTQVDEDGRALLRPLIYVGTYEEPWMSALVPPSLAVLLEPLGLGSESEVPTSTPDPAGMSGGSAWLLDPKPPLNLALVGVQLGQSKTASKTMLRVGLIADWLNLLATGWGEDVRAALDRSFPGEAENES
ncbi:hypothetical protein [Hyalangium sp.]|uniref:hypothetical protein n=1 Tax=Hyalangium sp. TaxID=2028555 RepID=UPI002D554EBF|nr:hypothetical protein [Hyalangium sp.]HYI00685.1 hypothetical protein [Hyalangium sp.]